MFTGHHAWMPGGLYPFALNWRGIEGLQPLLGIRRIGDYRTRFPESTENCASNVVFDNPGPVEVFDEDRDDSVSNQQRAVENEVENESLLGFEGPLLIEDEVRGRVEDRPILVDLHTLDPVGMTAEHQIRTGFNSHMGSPPVEFSRYQCVFDPPVEIWDDHIGYLTGTLDVFHDVLTDQRSNAA